MNKITELTKQVEFILEKFPETRNSDIYLTIKVRREFDGIGRKMRPEEMFMLPQMTYISRIRRRIQNKQFRFLPTQIDIVRKRRMNEARRVKEMSL